MKHELNSNYSSARIATNTIALYIRTFFSMLIGLYASRVLLNVLGVDDFGIYNVLGSAVTMFSFLNASMMVSSQRFMSYELGKGNQDNVNNVFCTSINMQVIISVILFIMTEFVGCYLLYHYLKIPVNRLPAAFWVLQFSILALVVNILSVPYNALIVAKEDMKSFAYIDILKSLLQLSVIFVIEYSNFGFDKLILYALLIFIVQIVIRIIYSSYCGKKYFEAKYRLYVDKQLLKSMLSFASWTTLSGISVVVINQGIGILYNMFYGVTINAAIGIANQINAGALAVISNFSTSFTPQITKNYAIENWNIVRKLHFTGSKLAFVLFSMVAIPIIINIDYILLLWLKNVPTYTAGFVRIILFITLITTLTTTANTIVRSTGRVRNYELTINFFVFVSFILCYIFMRYTSQIYLPYMTFVVNVCATSIFMTIYSCHCINARFKDYFFTVHLRMLLPVGIATFISWLIKPEDYNSFKLMFHVAFTILSLVTLSYYIGLTSAEKTFMKNLFYNMYRKIVER